MFEKDYEENFQEDEFHSILDRLGIKSQALVLQRFPFHKNGDTYSVSVTSITLETDKENQEQKRKYQICLVSEKKGKKLVAKFEADEFGGNAQVQYVVGFFQSPFENRIVILTEGLGGSLEGCTSIIHKSLWCPPGRRLQEVMRWLNKAPRGEKKRLERSTECA